MTTYTVTYEADGHTSTVRLSRTQCGAVVNTAPDGTCWSARDQTLLSLVRLGLADAITGQVTYRNRHQTVAKTFEGVFSGARLNTAGKAVRDILNSRDDWREQ